MLNPHVKTLGVFLDNTLSMEQHISHLCRSAYLAMRQIASIRRYLTVKSTVRLVCSFVLSRLDTVVLPLQVFLPLISHASREYKTMQPDLSSKNQKDSMSHRFSNNYTGFRFKHALTTNLQHLLFDTLMVLCLSITLYWPDIYQPSRSLRSSNDRLLKVPRWKLKSFGYRSFSYQGPVV